MCDCPGPSTARASPCACACAPPSPSTSEPIVFDDDMLAAAFDALPTDEEVLDRGDDRGKDQGKGKGRARDRDEDIDPEIIPSEEEAWSAWPTALDEYRVEEAFAGLSEVEKGWLFFELALIEPALLVDAVTGFPKCVFEDIALNGGVYPCVARYHALKEGEVWRTRMQVTVPRDDWLLTLAQTRAIPPDVRDTFMLNLFLIAYPFGQYLLHSFSASLVDARSLWIATALSVASPREQELGAKERKQRREEKRRLEHELEDAYPCNSSGLRRWELDWSLRTVDMLMKDVVGAGQGEGEGGMAGIWAHRSTTRDHTWAQVIAFEIEHMIPSPSSDPGPCEPNLAIIHLRALVQLALGLARVSDPVLTCLKDLGLITRVVQTVHRHRDQLVPVLKALLELDVHYERDMAEIEQALRDLRGIRIAWRSDEDT